jgi:phage recombination protein Bet
MATTAMALKDFDAEQVELIKRTVAAGATNDELKLFLFDCQRRGVHPLDKLLHFTKRNGKYTPITSIDFLRTRAHETHECAGISDPEFVGEPKATGFSARVVVKRVVAGHIAEFAATARWDEYKPQSNDFMWSRMPHTMLGKCAEALALRKAFPQELAGLYTGDEMAQAGKAETHAETVNTETGEIIEQAATPAKALPAPVVEETYTGIITAKGPRKVGAKMVYDFNVDEQVVSTTELAVAEQAGHFDHQRGVVTFTRTAKGGLMLLSVAQEPMLNELPADGIF